MKTFKQIDFWAQVILIAAGIMWCAVLHNFILVPYLVVGSWQLLSVFIHALFQKRFLPSRDRKYYFRALLIIVLLSLLIPIAGIFYGFLLLLITPLMAAWYAFICYTENTMLKHKSLVHLK